jgi:hypothetical protein
MKKKAKKEFGEATCASVKKEMAKPRMSKSVREDARIAPGMLRKSEQRYCGLDRFGAKIIMATATKLPCWNQMGPNRSLRRLAQRPLSRL